MDLLSWSQRFGSSFSTSMKSLQGMLGDDYDDLGIERGGSGEMSSSSRSLASSLRRDGSVKREPRSPSTSAAAAPDPASKVR